MNGAARAMRNDEPLMIAWKAYQETEDFKNTMAWAGKSSTGGLWACFVAGWIAAGGKIDPR